jgi:hypothetical protein
MKLVVWLVLLLPACAAAQGVVQGRAVDAANDGALLAEPATVCAVHLPQTSHPFNEITAATWQQAMTALAEGREFTTPLGKLEGGIKPLGAGTTTADGSGAFRLENLPLDTRLGLAVRVDGLWWPLREEVFLTAQNPQAEVTIPYCRLGAENPQLELHSLRLEPLVRQNLKYGGIMILETLRLTNTDPDRAALVEIALDVAIVPGTVARHLPAMYGSHLLFLQGWSLGRPVSRPEDAAAAGAWMFGGQTMHGSAPTYTRAAQDSADNWHPLQRFGLLAPCGAGETLFRENPSPDGRAASLVFRRVVPPAVGGAPGVLELRLVHQAGARMADPGQRTRLIREFPLPLQRVEAEVHDGVTLAALVVDSHRRLLADGTSQTGLTRYAGARKPALEAGERAELVLGFDAALQQRLADMEARAAGTAQAEPAARDAKPALNTRAVFLALAALFGMAFLVALVASMRKPREQQLARLNRMPVTRDEAVAALKELESDYRHGKLPATAYLEQKQRLVNRLVEFDAGES